MAVSIMANSAAKVTKMVTTSTYVTTVVGLCGVLSLYLVVVGPESDGMGADTVHRRQY